MVVYCAGIISGSTGEKVTTYFETTAEKLRGMGFEVLYPMIGKGWARTELEFKAEGYVHTPVSTNHAIRNRDLWMVRNSDIVYVNLLGAERVSIGCVSEIAWASLLGKHIVVVMEKNNIHQHAFVIENVDIIFNDEDSALSYLQKLSSRKI